MHEIFSPLIRKEVTCEGQESVTRLKLNILNEEKGVCGDHTYIKVKVSLPERNEDVVTHM